MTLLITLFLVLVNIFNNVTTNSPKAEGLTAIEIWMLVCILFVFGQFLISLLMNSFIIIFMINNTSLAAKSPLAHRLQYCII